MSPRTPPASQNVVEMYVQQRLSIPQIAAAIGDPKSRVRTALLNAGVALRSRKDGVRLRRDDLSSQRRGRKRGPHSEATRRRMSEQRHAWAEANAAGISVRSGYAEHTRGEHKGRLVHDVIMEARIGRRMRADEIVHHIDGDRLNNNENNLALMTRSAHSRLHRREDQLSGNIRGRKANGTFA